MLGAKFVDTNIWIYAHLRKPNEPRHAIALELVSGLNEAVISPQVVVEYYNVMLRSGQDDAWIQGNLDTMLSYVRLQALNAAVVRRDWQIRNRLAFQFGTAKLSLLRWKPVAIFCIAKTCSSGKLSKV